MPSTRNPWRAQSKSLCCRHARVMLIRHLFDFVTLAKERHFARGAEACNIAQPTLSAAIR